MESSSLWRAIVFSCSCLYSWWALDEEEEEEELRTSAGRQGRLQLTMLWGEVQLRKGWVLLA